ncbi:MAG: M48 family metallopeptidase [bacterium]
MDFFEHKDRALKKSKYLLALFFLSTFGVLIFSFIIIYLGAFWMHDYNVQATNQLIIDNKFEIGFFLFGVFLIIMFGSLFKTVSLRKGGKVIAEMMGAKEIDVNTSDLDEQKVLNVVHEMSISSSLSRVPSVYIMEDDAINAFAAGWHEDDAIISLTRGAINKLNRNELQAVVGHEISHIQHGDMNQNIRLMGIIHGLLLLAYVGQFIIRSSLYSSIGRRNKDGRVVIAMVAVGLGLIVVGSVGMLFGNIIKAAISRQREFLADASAVQYTRSPDSMSGALKKIAGMGKDNYLKEAKATQMNHMFFTKSVHSFFATHPPIEERIRRVSSGYGER